jgi:hypothetical protein
MSGGLNKSPEINSRDPRARSFAVFCGTANRNKQWFIGLDIQSSLINGNWARDFNGTPLRPEQLYRRRT